VDETLRETKERVITAALGFVPYVLLAWVISEVGGGLARDFWSVLGVLVAARFFFSVVEFVGGVLAWRVYGKRVTVRRFLSTLQARAFPPRRFMQDSTDTYLYRISEDPEYSADAKELAREIERALATSENLGLLFGMRLRAAWDAALELHSPPRLAPPFAFRSAEKGEPN
jgi:hypothetical protein